MTAESPMEVRREWEDIYKSGDITHYQTGRIIYGDSFLQKGKTLDVCSGSFGYKKASKKNMTALDFSYNATKMARDHGVVAVCSTVDNIPFRDNIFDTVTCFGMSRGGYGQYVRMMKEMSRVSKDRIIISLDHPEGIMATVHPMEYKVRLDGCLLYFEDRPIATVFDEPNVKKLADETQLKVEKMKVIRKGDIYSEERKVVEGIKRISEKGTVVSGVKARIFPFVTSLEDLAESEKLFESKEILVTTFRKN